MEDWEEGEEKEDKEDGGLQCVTASRRQRSDVARPLNHKLQQGAQQQVQTKKSAFSSFSMLLNVGIRSLLRCRYSPSLSLTTVLTPVFTLFHFSLDLQPVVTKKCFFVIFFFSKRKRMTDRHIDSEVGVQTKEFKKEHVRVKLHLQTFYPLPALFISTDWLNIDFAHARANRFFLEGAAVLDSSPLRQEGV